MIRRAEERDFADIKKVKESLSIEISNLDDLAYKLSIQKSGFLLKNPYTIEEHRADLNKIFLVYEEDGVVKGFIRIDEAQEMKQDKAYVWYHPELKEAYFALPHADIGGIGVLPDINEKGVATELLNQALEELKKKQIIYLFSFVILSPITNIPSILFHEKNGFERIALCPEAEIYEMKDFSSIMYGKKI